MLCLLTVSASAAYIPEDVITENRDGRQLIIKTFQLGPTDDPTALVEDLLNWKVIGMSISKR